MAKRFLKLFSIPFLFFSITVGLSHIPYLRLKNIEFSGVDILEKEKILEILKKELNGRVYRFFPKDSVFLTDEKKLAAQIGAYFPEIEKIGVKKKYFSSGLSINLSKRSIFGLYCFKDKCFFLDKNAIIFKPAPQMEGSAVLKFIDEAEGSIQIKLGERPILENFDKVFDFSVRLFENQDFRLTKVLIKSKDEIEIFTTENWRIIIDNALNPEKTSQNLAIALNNIKKKEALDYIDLRFGSKIYYKFKEGL